MPQDKHQLVQELKASKQHRTLGEIRKLLEAFGFVERRARKENSVWSRGVVSLTLPTPHDKFLKTAYVRLVIRKIEEAEILDREEELEWP
jgi:hypothetical protein